MKMRRPAASAAFIADSASNPNQCPRVIVSPPPENVGGSVGRLISNRNAPDAWWGKLAGAAFGSDPKNAVYAPGFDEENVNSPLCPDVIGKGFAGRGDRTETASGEKNA